MAQTHWCEYQLHEFEVEDPTGVHRIKAHFHSGFITVCPSCYDLLMERGLYDDEGQWRKRAAHAAETTGWKATPFQTLEEAVSVAQKLAGLSCKPVEEEGFNAYLCGDWLLAQKDDGTGNVMQLDLSNSSNRMYHKRKPRPKPPYQRLRVATPIKKMECAPGESLERIEARLDEDFARTGVVQKGRFVSVEVRDKGDAPDTLYYIQFEGSTEIYSLSIGFVPKSTLKPQGD